MTGPTDKPSNEHVNFESGAGDDLRVRVTPRMLRVLRTAADIAEARVGHRVIGTEHVFRAVLDDPYEIPTQAITRHNGVDAIRASLDRLMASKDYRTGSDRVHPDHPE